MPRRLHINPVIINIIEIMIKNSKVIALLYSNYHTIYVLAGRVILFLCFIDFTIGY